jgi:hypothetical protein
LIFLQQSNNKRKISILRKHAARRRREREREKENKRKRVQSFKSDAIALSHLAIDQTSFFSSPSPSGVLMNSFGRKVSVEPLQYYCYYHNLWALCISPRAAFYLAER